MGRTKGAILLVPGKRTFDNPWNRSFPEALGYEWRFAFQFVKVNCRERDWGGDLGTVWLGRELRLGSCTVLSMTSRCAAFAKATYRARILGKDQSWFEGRDLERPLPNRWVTLPIQPSFGGWWTARKATSSRSSELANDLRWMVHCDVGNENQSVHGATQLTL